MLNGSFWAIKQTFQKVFSPSLIENLTVFSKQKDNEQHSFLVQLCGYAHSCAYTPYYSSVGILHRLFLLGFCQNLRLDERKVSSTLSLFIITAHSGLVGKKKQTYYEVRKIPLVNDQSFEGLILFRIVRNCGNLLLGT